VSARLLVVILGAALIAPAGASAAAIPSSLTRHTLHCHQTYASYAPNGLLDHYGQSSEWKLRLSNNGPHYENVYGDGIPERGAHAGPMTYSGHRLTFTDGPFANKASGWRLTGRYVKRGAKMPHDVHTKRRFSLVLRSRFAKHSDLAPPHRESDALSYFYCK
jgi:hypothetical protein